MTMGRSSKIPDRLFAAVRDGDMTQSEAARQAGVSRQAFEQAFSTFRVSQVRQRSRRALAACTKWLRYCIDIGWSRAEIDDLERIWWRHHDEHGNLLKTPRAYQ
jgi:hypothetical protein